MSSRFTRPVRSRGAIAACLFASAALLAGCGSASDEADSADAADLVNGGLSGQVRDPLPNVGDQSLPNAADADKPFYFKAPKGQILLVNFGYTHCPDICPTTLADAKKAVASLGKNSKRVNLAMVTVDPTRDTDSVMAGYVKSFFPDGAALRTDDAAALAKVAEPFGASYSVTPAKEPGGEPEVAHSAYLYAIDDAGKIQVQWPFGTTAESISKDLDTLLSS